MIYVSADIDTNYLQGSQTILVEEQVLGLMLVVVVSYSVQLDHIVQLPPADLLAVVGINFSFIIGHLATMYCLLNHVLTRYVRTSIFMLSLYSFDDEYDCSFLPL